MVDSHGWVSSSMPYLVADEHAHGDVWAAEAASNGARGTHRITHAGEVVPPAAVADLLGLAEGEQAVVRRRVVYLDDQPVERADSYFPVSVARGTRLAETRKVPGGAIALLAELGHTAHTVQEDVTARPSTDEDRALFALEDNDPVLVQLRVVHDGRGHVFEVDVMAAPAKLRRLRYQIKVG